MAEVRPWNGSPVRAGVPVTRAVRFASQEWQGGGTSPPWIVAGCAPGARDAPSTSTEKAAQQPAHRTPLRYGSNSVLPVLPRVLIADRGSAADCSTVHPTASPATHSRRQAGSPAAGRAAHRGASTGRQAGCRCAATRVRFGGGTFGVSLAVHGVVSQLFSPSPLPLGPTLPTTACPSDCTHAFDSHVREVRPTLDCSTSTATRASAGRRSLEHREGLSELLARIRSNGVIAADSGTELTAGDDDPTRTLIREVLGASTHESIG